MFKVKFDSDTSSWEAERSSNLACKTSSASRNLEGFSPHNNLWGTPIKEKGSEFQKHLFPLQIPKEAAVSLIGSTLLIIGSLELSILLQPLMWVKSVSSTHNYSSKVPDSVVSAVVGIKANKDARKSISAVLNPGIPFVRGSLFIRDGEQPCRRLACLTSKLHVHQSISASGCYRRSLAIIWNQIRKRTQTRGCWAWNKNTHSSLPTPPLRENNEENTFAPSFKMLS